MEAGVADREARELARRAVGVGAAVDEQRQQARRAHVRVEGVTVLGDVAQQAAHLGAHAGLAVLEQRQQPRAHARDAQRAVVVVHLVRVRARARVRVRVRVRVRARARTRVRVSVRVRDRVRVRLVVVHLAAAAVGAAAEAGVAHAREVAQDEQRVGERGRRVGGVQQQLEQLGRVIGLQG